MYDIRDFAENDHSDNGREKLKKSYIGRIPKNPGIRSSYNFCDFSSKMAN